MIPKAEELPDWLKPGYAYRVKKTLHQYLAALQTVTCEVNGQTPKLEWVRDALTGCLRQGAEHAIACTAINLTSTEVQAGCTVHWKMTGKDNIAWLYNDMPYADETHLRWVIELTEDNDYDGFRPQFAIMGFTLQEFFLKYRINNEQWLSIPAQVYASAIADGYAHEEISTHPGYRTLSLRNGKRRLSITAYPHVVQRSQERMLYLYRRWEQLNAKP